MELHKLMSLGEVVRLSPFHETLMRTQEGGPIGLVQNGDIITIDISTKRMHVLETKCHLWLTITNLRIFKSKKN